MRPFAGFRRRDQVLAIAIVLSVAIHFIIGPFFSRWHQVTLLNAGVPPDRVVMSTSIRIERRAKPEPQVRRPPTPPRPRTQVEPHRATMRKQIVTPHLHVAQTPPPPHELARNDAHATESAPSPPPRNDSERRGSSLTLDRASIDRAEQQFAKTIAQTRASDNPLVVPSSPPAAPKRYAINLEGTANPLRSGDGILYPIKSWKADGYDYYYVDYTMVFSDGSRDAGRVPWPIRYRPNQDPFALQYQGRFPLPPPLPGYVLPQDVLPLNPTLRPYFPNLYPNG